MLETFVNFISSVPWYWVLIAAMMITLLENVFPPSPSDSVIIFTGTLVSLGEVSFIPLLITTTIGSIVGFSIMFYLGLLTGRKMVESRRISFLTPERIKRPNKWLDKYGYYIIAFNRFLSGTRGVISFLAGMTEMSPVRSIALAGFSAVIWNFILIYLGIILGKNWRLADQYVERYGEIIFIIIIVIILLISIKILYNNYIGKKKNKSDISSQDDEKENS
jgi:membrane protein DedA with SNARE-associated domain